MTVGGPEHRVWLRMTRERYCPSFLNAGTLQVRARVTERTEGSLVVSERVTFVLPSGCNSTVSSRTFGPSPRAHSTRRARLAILALALLLLPSAPLASPFAVVAPDRASVALGPVEPLADRPEKAEDETVGALLARGNDGAIAFVEYYYGDVVHARQRLRGGRWSPFQEVPCAGPGDPQRCLVPSKGQWSASTMRSSRC